MRWISNVKLVLFLLISPIQRTFALTSSVNIILTVHIDLSVISYMKIIGKQLIQLLDQ